ncbi:CoA transferase subunit A [Paenibacillus albiflavus]|uniref:CoA transferase subunit A n=1 Tax=Paenibacillus albiflavus TaxID=2545760 RepID=A0A4R4EE61_9BACL|nr:CoA transferase subunit A [Paenibacillus albiflavus]TCZ76305.1 CoA transferase subunit A [Paenibacillus albiflavus]
MGTYIAAKDAVSVIQSGSSIMVGGFGLVGSPLTLIEQLLQVPVKDLTIISNNLGEPGKGLGRLLLEKRVKKAIGSFFTSNPDVVKAYQAGELEIELIPQGTLSEAIRAGGAGLGGIYVLAGVGTDLEAGKETRVIRDKTYLLQPSLRANVALIKAHKADRLGNLVYRKSARNFNPNMATAADLVIAEVDEIVEVGELSPEEIVTPHLFVDYFTLTGGSAHG